MIENLEELKDQLEVKFTSKFITDYKVSETTDLRVSIRTNPIKYYLIINDEAMIAYRKQLKCYEKTASIK